MFTPASPRSSPRRASPSGASASSTQKSLIRTAQLLSLVPPRTWRGPVRGRSATWSRAHPESDSASRPTPRARSSGVMGGQLTRVTRPRARPSQGCAHCVPSQVSPAMARNTTHERCLPFEPTRASGRREKQASHEAPVDLQDRRPGPVRHDLDPREGQADGLHHLECCRGFVILHRASAQRRCHTLPGIPNRSTPRDGGRVRACAASRFATRRLATGAPSMISVADGLPVRRADLATRVQGLAGGADRATNPTP